MKIATEPITDPYGGLYTHTRRLERFSIHTIKEVPSPRTRQFLCRFPPVYRYYRDHLTLTGFDIMHSRSDPWFIDLCRRSKTSHVTWVHTYHALFFANDYPAGLAPWQEEINNALLNVARNADIKICVSQWGHDLLKQLYNIDTTVIPNGIDPDITAQADASRFIRKHKIHDFILFVGSYREVKFPQRFVALAKQMPKKEFVMIGDGLTREKLTSYYDLDLPSNLHLLGRMPRTDVLDAMAACQVFVMTSKNEGCPNSLLEAMALSRPVVVPRHTGCLEVVGSDQNGFLFDPDSLDDLITKTARALVTPEVGVRGKQHVIAHFNWLNSAKKMDEIYSDCKNNH